MEVKVREIITENYTELISLMDYELLLSECIARKIINISMKEDIENESDDTDEKHGILLMKLTEQGLNAIRDFIDICRTHFKTAAAFIQSKMDIKGAKVLAAPMYEADVESEGPEKDGIGESKNNNANLENLPLELYTENVDNIDNINVEKTEEFCFNNSMQFYFMKSRKRGVFFFVNIVKFDDHPEKYRNGAFIDKRNLITLFREFGFLIFYYESITLQQFHNLVDQLVNSSYLRSTESLVFCVLSHGGMHDNRQMIQFSCNKLGLVHDIVEKFSNTKCPNMFGKPKVFLFPMCRGHIEQNDGIDTYDSVPGPMRPMRHRTKFSDILICYAATKGFVAFRDRYVGTWYIHAFVEILAKYACKTHIEDMLKLITENVEIHCQSRSNSDESYEQSVAWENIGFKKHLFFNPGYYEDQQ